MRARFFAGSPGTECSIASRSAFAGSTRRHAVDDEPQRRASDAGRVARFWHWLDERDIIRMVGLIAFGATSIYMIFWSIHFAEHSPRPGTDVAAIIAAVEAPLNLTLAWLFSAFGK